MHESTARHGIPSVIRPQWRGKSFRAVERARSEESVVALRTFGNPAAVLLAARACGGDIRIAAGHSGYHLVRASTSIGDGKGNGYGESSGWLGKTLHYQGDGKYESQAHVGVGDITLE
jgi:hypothetical protein